MRTFRCPYCNLVQKGLMIEAAHRCIKNRNRMTPLKEEETDE